MKVGLKASRAAWLVMSFALGLSSCKKDERAPGLDRSTTSRNVVDCSEIPSARLPATSAAFGEAQCEVIAIDPRSTNYAPPLMQRGFVEVPLGPGSEETISIAVARIFSDAENPREDPIVYLDGGPGGPSIGNADWLHPLIREMSPDRDVILVDQRGVGRSRPSLNCPDPMGDESLEESIANCYERLSGVTDLDEFDSVNNANDIEFIRQALGYEQWNLLGISYGTRLGLTIMRDYPEGVRAALIDSVVPLQRDILAEIGINGYNSFSAIFAACSADPECSLKYPEPMAQLLSTSRRLNDKPAELDVGLLTGDYFVRFLFQLLYSPYSIAYVPQLVDDASEGEFELFESLLQKTSGGPPFSFGMHLSLHCAEEVPFSSPADYESFDAGIPEELRSSLSGVDYLDWCRSWPVETAPASENEPAVSDVPALVISGEFDPVTPPSFAEAAYAFLTNSTYLMIENESHGASLSECGAEIAQEFFDDPGGTIDSSCLGMVPELEFLSTTGSGASGPAGAERIRFATEKPSDETIDRVAEDLKHRLR